MASYKRRARATAGTGSSSPVSTTGPRTTRTATRRSGNGGKAANTHRSHKPSNNKKKHGKHRVLKWVLCIFGGLIGAGLIAGIAAFAYLYTTTEIPQPGAFALAEKTTVYYADGTTEIGSYAEQNREIISCDALPDYVGQAIVASEDRTFYSNSGIDLKGIARAFINNVTTGTRQGGSTITQQYAERYYMGETTSYVGKAREAILAIKIAQSESKDEVLCNYMNTIYLGRNSYGIQAAAKSYFNKEAKDLTLSEAAMLAGIIPAPSTWDPAQNQEMAQQRFERVLSIMQEDGYITASEKSEAAFPATADIYQQNIYQGPNGYLLTMVQRELVDSESFTQEDLDTGGYRIVTTIDKAKQDAMQTVGDTRPEDMPASIQVGGIAVEQSTGAVVSIYAGSDYLTHQLNNADQAVFEPGSTMKPFALLGAAQEGVNFSTLFNGNSHQHFSGITSEVNNALNINWGNIDLYQATANSVNTVFMAVNEKLTPQRTAQIAHEAGITGEIDEDSPYNVLGINALTVWDLAQGHATIANNGVKNTLHMVASVKDSNGADLYNAPSENEKVFDANDCALVQKAMQGTTTYGTASSVSSKLGRPIAGKSGTANDENAASFVGYTPDLLNVWAIWNPDADGNPQVVPAFGGYGVTSTGYPAHLFTEYMSQALAGTAVEQFATPKDSGKVGGPDGTWGLGGSKSSSTNGQSGTQNGSSNSDSSSGSTSDQSSTQEFAQQCLNNPSYSTECPNYPGTSSGGNGDNGNSGSGNGDGGNGGNGDSGGNSGNSNGNGNSGSGDSGGNTGSNSGNGNGTSSGETTGGNS